MVTQRERAASDPTPSGAAEAEGLRRFVGLGVHDLRNALAVVRGSLEWLETELRESPDTLEAVRDASTAAAQMLAVVDDLGAVAHLETLRREPIDLGDLVSRAVRSAMARHAAREITFAAAMPLRAAIVGDPRLVARAIDALVDESARVAPRGSCVEIEVRAGGVGVGAVEVEIGLRGVTAAAAPTESIDVLGGAGIGAHFAQRIANEHGGALLVVPTSTLPRAILRLPR